jgi:uncharacterized protein (DUF983 family)
MAEAESAFVASYRGRVALPKHTFPRMMLRGLTLRCPWCASRRTFIRGWFHRHERCRTCGIKWHREEGFELGAVTMNTIVTFGALTIAMVVGFVRTSPDIPVLPFVLALGAVAVVVPVVIYPFTYTMWLAFDLAVHPPDAAELAEAAAARLVDEALDAQRPSASE